MRDDLDEEMAFHIERQVEKYVAVCKGVRDLIVCRASCQLHPRATSGGSRSDGGTQVRVMGLPPSFRQFIPPDLLESIGEVLQLRSIARCQTSGDADRC